MAAFPTLSKPQDSKYFTESQEDPVMRSPVEGGYEFSRPRYTRAPRKMFTTGFTEISDADKTLLQTSWDVHRGGSDVVTWTHPVDGAMSVRYEGAFSFRYVGIGGFHKWDVKISLKQV